MEELHHQTREVPYGYWTLWVVPALTALRRRLRGNRAAGRISFGELPTGLQQLSGPH